MFVFHHRYLMVDALMPNPSLVDSHWLLGEPLPADLHWPRLDVVGVGGRQDIFYLSPRMSGCRWGMWQ
jgi:hypothetical protein